MEKHFAGFVMLLGNPNAGKSSLLNKMIGEKISIVSPKIQTTRQRIKGIITGKNYQVVFIDTPGLLQPKYELHKSMMEEINMAIDDADIILVVVGADEPDSQVKKIAEITGLLKKKKIIVLNKTDLLKTIDEQKAAQDLLKIQFNCDDIYLVSAKTGDNLNKLKQSITDHLPENQPYYEGDEITDRTTRYIISEIIREKIFELYREEIPYSSEVIITGFKDKENITTILATIFTERESQRAIIIGNKGQSIKKLGTDARKICEEFLGRKVFLELTVKVKENWRNNKQLLKQLGYK